jgi:hypothetical protein
LLGIDLTIANNDGVVARALLPNSSSSDEDNVFEIFANLQFEGLKQNWPLVSEVINLNKTGMVSCIPFVPFACSHVSDLYGSPTSRKEFVIDTNRPISPGRERHKEKFVLDALLSPRPKKVRSFGASCKSYLLCSKILVQKFLMKRTGKTGNRVTPFAISRTARN